MRGNRIVSPAPRNGETRLSTTSALNVLLVGGAAGHALVVELGVYFHEGE